MPFPVDKMYVKEAERSLGVVFPDSFRTEMQRRNGGMVLDPVWETTWQLHPFLDRSERKRLARTCNDIIRETEEAKQWRTFPQVAVAIAANGGGDLMVFMPEAEGAHRLGPTVFLWDHETGDLIEAAPDFAALRRLD